MGVRLQRQLTSRDALSPGQYYASTSDHMHGPVTVYYVCCPMCACIGVLSSTHVIEPRSGKVLPAYRCLGTRCGFHDWLQFEATE